MNIIPINIYNIKNSFNNKYSKRNEQISPSLSAKTNCPVFSGMNSNTKLYREGYFPAFISKNIINNKDYTDNDMTCNERFKSFENDITDYILNSKELDSKVLNNFIQKYSPDTTIDDIKNMPMHSNTNIGTNSYTQHPIMICEGDNALIVKELPKTIFIAMPQNKEDKEQRYKFLYNLLHEATHVFQEEAPDRQSKGSYISEYINNNNVSDYTLSGIKVMPKFFTAIEAQMLMIFSHVIKSNNLLPIEMPDFDINKLNDGFKDITGMSAGDTINAIIYTQLKNVVKEYPKFDFVAVLKYVSNIATKEQEAYQNSLNAIKKVYNTQNHTDIDFQIYLYSLLKKNADLMVNEIEKS